MQNELNILLTNYPQLSVCRDEIRFAFNMMKNTCSHGGLIMVCGNGGSAADAEHIVGELMKGFKSNRPITPEQKEALLKNNLENGVYLTNHLQRGIPAISLVSQTALSSAFGNDVAPDMVYAQQVFVYGKSRDLLIALSTSGNAQNVVNACKVANSFGLYTLGLTGENGGKLREVCDITIRVPAIETFRVQEYHLPVYHTLCAMLEKEFYYE